MRISDLGRYAFGVCAAAMLAACGGGSGTPLSPSPAGITAERTHVRPAYSVLYSFKGSGDGAYPFASLINVNGTLYSTTVAGGANICGSSGQGCGTVFSITASGTETVLRSFRGGTKRQGQSPFAGLINVNGTLYGTTYKGGANGLGTVFAVTTAGQERVLHSFGKGSDGSYPEAGLINIKGTLYGTTWAGGGSGCTSTDGCGTVFSIATSGAETVLHSFAGGKGDGANPEAGLINVKGTLYGTTYNGGAGGNYCDGCGTVFSITTSGAETVLHSFGSSGDGAGPYAGLINVKGTLYGTTENGGAKCSPYGCGAVFAITTSGKETVLYSFKGKPDGAAPFAGLISVNGRLYSTTYYGGATCSSSEGCGTVFAITTSGTETVLHGFKGYPDDGAFSAASLINVNGTLYGTTTAGGANCSESFGCGTVFSLSP